MRAGQKKPVLHSDPYTVIAPVYDHMMSHVAYEDWAEYIVEIIRRFGNDGKRILDAGCGTGRFAGELLKNGYTVYGFDRSIEMLFSCRARGLKNLWQADLKNMGAGAFADVLICLYDTVHYVKPNAIGHFFLSANQALKPGGLLIFDVVTESFLKEYWGDYLEWDEVGDRHYSRKSWYDPRQKCQHTEIRVETKDLNSPTVEHHRQWVFSFDDLSGKARESGFSEQGRFDACSFEAGGETSDRIHFVFRKEKS